jgi:hypothetical protein
MTNAAMTRMQDALVNTRVVGWACTTTPGLSGTGTRP